MDPAWGPSQGSFMIAIPANFIPESGWRILLLPSCYLPLSLSLFLLQPTASAASADCFRGNMGVADGGAASTDRNRKKKVDNRKVSVITEKEKEKEILNQKEKKEKKEILNQKERRKGKTFGRQLDCPGGPSTPLHPVQNEGFLHNHKECVQQQKGQDIWETIGLGQASKAHLASQRVSFPSSVSPLESTPPGLLEVEKTPECTVQKSEDERTPLESPMWKDETPNFTVVSSTEAQRREAEGSGRRLPTPKSSGRRLPTPKNLNFEASPDTK